MPRDAVGGTPHAGIREIPINCVKQAVEKLLRSRSAVLPLARNLNVLTVRLAGKFNQQEITQTFQDPGISGFIQKPYSLAELRKKLRAVLDAA